MLQFVMIHYILLSLLEGLFLLHCQSKANIYYVKPNSTSACPPSTVGWPCKTLDEYALNSTQDLDNMDNVTMLYLPGVHNLTRKLLVRGSQIITMVNMHDSEGQQVHIILHSSITIAAVSELNISYLSINGLSQSYLLLQQASKVNIDHVAMTGSALIIACEFCSTALISHVSFKGSVQVIAGSPNYPNDRAYNSVTIKNSVYHLSPTGNGLTVCNIDSLSISNISTISLPGNISAMPPSASFRRFCYFFPFGSQNTANCDLIMTKIRQVSIDNSVFNRTYGTGIYSESPSNAYVLIANSTISGHSRGGVMMTFLDNGVQMYFKNNTVSNNSNVFAGSTTASAFRIYSFDERKGSQTCKVYIINSRFIHNTHLVEKPTTTAFTSNTKLQVTVRDSEFTGNYGSAITAYNTIADLIVIAFDGTKTIFRNNTSHRGGAVHLFNSKIAISRNVSIYFEGNYAKDVGGAIYVLSTDWLSNYYEIGGNYGECFYELLKCNYDNYFSIQFINNSASNGGEHIYGAAILSECNLCTPEMVLSPLMTYSLFHLAHPSPLGFSPLSSTPSRVCLCDHSNNPHFFCADSSLIFNSKTVHPGEEFHLEAVLVGAEFGTGTGSVYTQFLPQNSDLQVPVLKPAYQYSQRVDNFRECKKLSYTVYSSNTRDILVLTTSDQTVLEYRNQEEAVKASEGYIPFSGTVPTTLLTIPIYINLTFLPCPPGFHLRGNPPGCECATVLTRNNMFCNFTNGHGYIYRNGTTWVKVSNSSFIILQRHCPFDYCQDQLTGVNFNDLDAQCAMNHAGTLCGGCREGYSLALGTNKCIPCSNDHNLSLLVFFAAAGFLLVFFIKYLNLTVSQGTINGLLIYANIVWAYQNIFFSSQYKSDGVTSKWFIFMRTFIAWLNLDFGVETCFAQGLTAYTKVWLQFMFPLYVWTIAGVMIISAHYSGLMTRLLGNNSVQVLATLFLLSYVKLLRAVVIVLVPAVLHSYPQGTNIYDSNTTVVWAFNGNLSYCGIPHILLFVVALLSLIFLWIPYTTILLLFQLLRRSSQRCLRWVNGIIPFFETYFGPFKPRHYYWVGLLLLVRGALLLVLTLTYTGTPSACLLALVIVITLLLVLLAFIGRVYKNHFLSALECSFLVNLQVLGASVLFAELTGTSKDIVVCVSIGVVFVQFIGIILFHILQILKKKYKKRPFFKQLNKDKARADRYPMRNSVSQGTENVFIIRNVSSQPFLEEYAENVDDSVK